MMTQTNHCIKIYCKPTLMYERFRLFNSPYQVHMKTTKPNNVGGNFIQTKKNIKYIERSINDDYIA